jgi:hypothetical protein
LTLEVVWAHNHSPLDWHQLNYDPMVHNAIGVLLIELETAGETIEPEALSTIFTRMLAISSPAKAGKTNGSMLSMPSDDPMFIAVGRAIGRLKAARGYVRAHLPRARRNGSAL